MSAVLYGNIRGEIVSGVGVRLQGFTLRQATPYLPRPGQPVVQGPAAGVADGSVTLSATGGGSGNPVVFSVDPATKTGVCKVSGANDDTVSYTAVGSCVIDANQADNAQYQPAPQTQQTFAVSAPRCSRVERTGISLHKPACRINGAPCRPLLTVPGHLRQG